METEKSGVDIENRFVRARKLDAALTFIRWLDDRNPFQGHWHPNQGPLPKRLDCLAGWCDAPPSWVIRNSWEDGFSLAHGSPVRGSRTLDWFMQRHGDLDERTVCPYASP